MLELWLAALLPWVLVGVSVLTGLRWVTRLLSSASATPTALKGSEDDDAAATQQSAHHEPHEHFAVNAMSPEEFQEQGQKHTLRALSKLRQQLLETSVRRASLARLSPTTTLPFIQFLNGRPDISEEHILAERAAAQGPAAVTAPQASVTRGTSPQPGHGQALQPQQEQEQAQEQGVVSVEASHPPPLSPSTFTKLPRTGRPAAGNPLLSPKSRPRVAGVRTQFSTAHADLALLILLCAASMIPAFQAHLLYAVCSVCGECAETLSDTTSTGRAPVPASGTTLHSWVTAWAVLTGMLVVTTRLPSLTAQALQLLQFPHLCLAPLLAFARPTLQTARYALHTTASATRFTARVPGFMGFAACLLEVLVVVLVPRLVFALAYLPAVLPALLGPTWRVGICSVLAAFILARALAPPMPQPQRDGVEQVWLLPLTVLGDVVTTAGSPLLPWSIGSTAGTDNSSATAGVFLATGLFGHTLITTAACLAVPSLLAVGAAAGLSQLMGALPVLTRVFPVGFDFVLVALVPLLLSWCTIRAIPRSRILGLVPALSGLLGVLVSLTLSSMSTVQLFNLPLVATDLLLRDPLLPPLICPTAPAAAGNVPHRPGVDAVYDLCLLLTCANSSHLLSHKSMGLPPPPPPPPPPPAPSAEAAHLRELCGQAGDRWCTALVSNGIELTLLDADTCLMLQRTLLALALGIALLVFARHQMHDFGIQAATAVLSALVVGVMTQRPFWPSFLFFLFFQTFVASRISNLLVHLLFANA